MKIRGLFSFLLLILALTLSSCATTGPKISKAELEQAEQDFNLKFLQASEMWLPRVHRVAYQLLTHPVPGHGDEKPSVPFTGVGVQELKKYAREAYGIPKEVQGVLVTGLYPGSEAAALDLQAGDVIEKVDGKKTKNLGAYFKRIRKADLDEGPWQVTADVWRNGEHVSVELPIEKVFYNAQFFLEPTPNLDASAAFSKINVGIGAIRYCRNDDELGFIMGHELAHATLKHSLKKFGASMGSAVAYGVLAGVIEAYTFPGLGDAMVHPMQQATDAAVSREYEREADYFGVQHAFHAGYDVRNGSRVFARLATDAPSFAVLSQTFASHPVTAERFLRLEKTVEELQTKFPSRFPQKPNADWEMNIPVRSGETMAEAVSRLIEEKKLELMPPAPTGVSVLPDASAKQLEEEMERKKQELAALEALLEKKRQEAAVIVTPKEQEQVVLRPTEQIAGIRKDVTEKETPQPDTVVPEAVVSESAESQDVKIDVVEPVRPPLVKQPVPLPVALAKPELPVKALPLSRAVENMERQKQIMQKEADMRAILKMLDERNAAALRTSGIDTASPASRDTDQAFEYPVPKKL